MRYYWNLISKPADNDFIIGYAAPVVFFDFRITNQILRMLKDLFLSRKDECLI